MTTSAAPADFLRVRDLDSAQLGSLLDLATAMKSDPSGYLDVFRGETLAMIFDKPSTRTRVSFSAAAYRLGMMPLTLRRDELQLDRGEPISDTGRVLSGYAAAIAVRTFSQRLVEELAEGASIPVVNALTDEHHPCQALADVLTLRERFGQLEGLKLAYVGDGNNVCNSLIEAGSLAGIEVVVASPPGYEPSLEGAVVEVEPAAAVADADAVYTDVWVSMGDDAERDERLARLAPYRVDAALMARAKPGAVFLHCLPAHRGEEVDAAVIDGPQSAVWQQAENRMWTEQALLHVLLRDRFDA